AATKLQLAGRLARDLTRCGRASGTAACTTKAEGVFGSGWGKADSRGSCGTVGDRTAVETLITGLAKELPVARAEEPVGAQCGQAQSVAAGKALRCTLRCRASALKAGRAVDPACVASCTESFAAQCAQAERAGDCRRPGTCGGLADRIAWYDAAIGTRLCVNCAPPPPCADRCTAAGPGWVGAGLCADACVQLVCRRDPYCCSAGWDALCVAHTAAVCPEPCPACGDGVQTGNEVCDPTALPSGCPAGLSCTPDCRG